jgi:hypothetical protein
VIPVQNPLSLGLHVFGSHRAAARAADGCLPLCHHGGCHDGAGPYRLHRVDRHQGRHLTELQSGVLGDHFADRMGVGVPGHALLTLVVGRHIPVVQDVLDLHRVTSSELLAVLTALAGPFLLLFVRMTDRACIRVFVAFSNFMTVVKIWTSLFRSFK